MYYLGLAWGPQPDCSPRQLCLAWPTSESLVQSGCAVQPALSFDKALALADPQADLDFICLLLRAGLTPEQWERINAPLFAR